MSLDEAREEIFDWMIKPDNAPNKNKGLREAVAQWWRFFKLWEAQDTFVAAMTEKRLAITQRPVGKQVYSMEANVLPGKKEAYSGYAYSVGTDSLAARLNPTNFEGNAKNGIKKKHALGLLDLSASLLNPKFNTIKGQLRWSLSTTKGGYAVVFIALPKVDDVAMYNYLKTYAADIKETKLLEMLRDIRHRMTRPKLADSQDIGATNYNIAAEGSAPMLKYGWTTKARGYLSDKTIDRAMRAAFDYSSMLDGAKEFTNNSSGKVVSSNELTIALREVAGKRFPVISEYSAEKDGFEVEGAEDLFKDGFIPDKWKNVVEMKAF